MASPSDWSNPISVAAGEWQLEVDPSRLLPSRHDLSRARLEAQRALMLARHVRATPILVTMDGVIFDGHHSIRAAVEERRLIDVVVTPLLVAASAASIMDLPVR
jgi:hypothetical protein